MTKSGPKNGRVAPEKSATPVNGVMTKENVTSNRIKIEMMNSFCMPGAKLHSFIFNVENPDEPSRVLKIFRKCFNNRVEENGEISSPPTCDEWLR